MKRKPTGPDVLTEREVALQADEDAEIARTYVMAALDPRQTLYRDHGPDRLLAAAQVHATLAARE